jgi:alpha-ketoglutaric semialdehyde dehydrogenase
LVSLQKIAGVALIGGAGVKGTLESFLAWDPARMKTLAPPFHTVDAAQIDHACLLAQDAFASFRHTSAEARAILLETIAARIMSIGDALITRAVSESGLPRARLENERERAVNQLHMFAALLREGAWCAPPAGHALPGHQPAPAVAGMAMMGVGPVAVFGASSFPLAFAFAGADSASALAAGCPVVVRSHPAHPGTSELVGHAVVQALQECGLPAGVFALLTGASEAVDQALVRHGAIKAVGFTGSRAGAQALMAVAAARPQPIPVFAEMSCVNPVFLLPGALASRGGAIARSFVAALAMGRGKLRTHPGLVLGVRGVDFERFCDAAVDAASAVPASPMRTPALATRYRDGVARLATHEDVLELFMSTPDADNGTARPALFVTSGAALLADPTLAQEMFGPGSLLVACRDSAQLLAIASQLEGQLTATLYFVQEDLGLVERLRPVLEYKTGRILSNDFPAVVELGSVMEHRSPPPAGPGSLVISAGSCAIGRFLRPIAYHNFDETLLPVVLQDKN